MNTKFNIQLIGYPQHLLYDIQDDVYYDSKEQIEEMCAEHPNFEVSEDDFEFDEEEFECACKSSFVSWYKDKMPNIVTYLGDPELDKPREYRCFHRGDYCFADVELTEDWLDVMLQWIEYNHDWFSERIFEEWQSRDGFWSFMDTHVEGWIENLKKEDERYIGQMLFYMAFFDDDNVNEEILYAIYEDNYVGCYNHLNAEKQDEYNKLVETEEN